MPIINRLEQEKGRDYQAGNFSWNDESKELTISFAKAYPKAVLRK